MSIAFVPLYVKYLGMEAYGIIGLFVILSACFALLDLGITPTMNREMAKFTAAKHTPQSIRDLLRSFEIMSAGLTVLIVGLITITAPQIATGWVQRETLSADGVAQAIAVMGVVVALRFMEGIYRGSMLGLQRHVLYNIIQVIMATLRGAGSAVILAFWSASLSAFFVWQGLVALLSLGTMATATYALLPAAPLGARVSLHALLAVRNFAAGMLGLTFLALMLTQVDKLLLSRLLPLTEYGVYALAAAVAAAPSQLAAPISTALFPRLSQLHETGNSKELARTFHYGAQLVSVAMGSGAVYLIAFSEPLLRLWTQNTELAHNAAPIVSLLALGNLLNGLSLIPYVTQLAHGWTSLAIRINICAVLLIVPALIVVTPIHGAKGAAWIWVALNAFYVLIGAQLMFRRLLREEKWLWYSRDLLRPLLAAGTAAVMLNWLLPLPKGEALQFVWLLAAGCGVVISATMSADLTRNLLKRCASLALLSIQSSTRVLKRYES